MSKYVISISREFGSGGRLIGKQLAARLGIPCYDRTIIQKTSEKSGLSPDFIARAEERARSRFHLSVTPIGIGTPAFAHQGVPDTSSPRQRLSGNWRMRGPASLWAGAATMCWVSGPSASRSLSTPTWKAG